MKKLLYLIVLVSSLAQAKFKTDTLIVTSSMTSPGANISTISAITQIKWADGTIQVSSPTAGGSSSVAGVSTQTIFIAAAGTLAMDQSFAPLVVISTKNYFADVARFDDTTRQFRDFSFVPSFSALTTSTVTFSITTTYATSGTGNIGWDLDYYCPPAGSLWGSVSLSTTSVTFPLQTTNWNVTVATWTASFFALGWTPGLACKGRISRNPGATGDITGDVYFHDVRIDIPMKVQ